MNISEIKPDPSQASSQVQQLSQAPNLEDGEATHTDAKPATGTTSNQVAGDSSSQ